MQFLEDQSQVTWYPIRLLYSCAGVRYEPSIGRDGRRRRGKGRFRSLDDPKEKDPSQNSHHPPLFGCVMERNKPGDGGVVKDFHCYMCKDSGQARALIQVSNRLLVAPPASVLQHTGTNHSLHETCLQLKTCFM